MREHKKNLIEARGLTVFSLTRFTKNRQTSFNKLKMKWNCYTKIWKYVATVSTPFAGSRIFEASRTLCCKRKNCKTNLKMGSGFQPCFTVEDFQRKCKNYKQTWHTAIYALSSFSSVSTFGKIAFGKFLKNNSCLILNPFNIREKPKYSKQRW